MNHLEHLDLLGSIEALHGERRALGDDFYIYEVTYSQQRGYPFRMDGYGCCICLEGGAEGNIDLMPCRLQPQQMAVNVPGQLLEQHSMSRDFRGIGIAMSNSFVQSLGLPYNFRLDLLLRDCPVLQLLPQQLDAMLIYCKMVHRLLETERPYQRETLHHLTCAFFYGIGSYLYQLSATRHFSTDETLMQRFINEVKTSYRRERKVAYYAERLNVSAGHLSAVIKRVSGKTPGDWIDDYVVSDARAMLKGSSLTVQQISQELAFPSQSFFGKYFKRITGLSPAAYREL
ncbi:MAG: helix-turn-helix domain-containing protein [Prevotella sp.]